MNIIWCLYVHVKMQMVRTRSSLEIVKKTGKHFVSNKTIIDRQTDKRNDRDSEIERTTKVREILNGEEASCVLRTRRVLIANEANC